VSIPELGLELASGTLGGIYTTIEGLLEKISDNLKDKNPFVGDSADIETKDKLEKFFTELAELQEFKKPFTVIIDDPLDDSFILNPFYPNPDPRVVTTTVSPC
jgi:zinc finger protein